MPGNSAISRRSPDKSTQKIESSILIFDFLICYAIPKKVTAEQTTQITLRVIDISIPYLNHWNMRMEKQVRNI